MGSICGKDNYSKRDYVNQSGSTGPQKVQQVDEEAIELKTKKEFQRQWEMSHDEVAQDIGSVWGLVKTLGNQDITKVYDFDRSKDIGAGHYGVVRRARLKIEPSKIYAIKSIEKSKLKGDITLLRNELEMLRTADHPNIIQFYEIFQDANKFHFVMEYCEGGDVTTKLEKDGPCSEERSKVIIFETLLAISHLHSTGVIHRDVKPDNFLFKTKDPNSPIKLIDFGLSKKVHNGGKLKSILGTPYYVAPEVLEKKGYDNKCDVWSAGIMLYLLLAADFPFKGSSQAMTFEKIRRENYSLTASDQLRTLSKEGRVFLAKLLDKDPTKRYSAREALRDPWFDKLNMQLNERGKKVLSTGILQRFRSFKTESQFCKEVIRILVMIHDDTKEVNNLKDAFFYVDSLNNGVINADEIKKAFHDIGHEDISDEEIQEIITSIQLRMKNIVTYTEFVTACIDDSFYRNQKYLHEAFNRFDINQDQFISYGDISDCFTRFGVDLPREEILKMISDADLNKDSKVSFEEFVKVMKADLHLASSNSLKKSSIEGKLDLRFGSDVPRA